MKNKGVWKNYQLVDYSDFTKLLSKVKLNKNYKTLIAAHEIFLYIATHQNKGKDIFLTKQQVVEMVNTRYGISLSKRTVVNAIKIVNKLGIHLIYNEKKKTKHYWENRGKSHKTFYYKWVCEKKLKWDDFIQFVNNEIRNQNRNSKNSPYTKFCFSIKKVKSILISLSFLKKKFLISLNGDLSEFDYEKKLMDPYDQIYENEIENEDDLSDSEYVPLCEIDI